MKRLHQAVLIASIFSLPLISHAESNVAPKTRADVRAELIAAEHAGVYPQSDVDYPNPATSNRPVAHASRNDAYGPSTSGSFASGLRTVRARVKASVRPQTDDIYRGQ